LSKSNFYVLWTQIVDDYCRRSLTFSRDKLIAIAGIAERYQAKIKDRYITGLWEYYILGWMMWERGRPGSGIHGFGHRFEEHQVPSWSWIITGGDFMPLGVARKLVRGERDEVTGIYSPEQSMSAKPRATSRNSEAMSQSEYNLIRKETSQSRNNHDEDKKQSKAASNKMKKNTSMVAPAKSGQKSM
jgi:hypothetical protein